MVRRRTRFLLYSVLLLGVVYLAGSVVLFYASPKPMRVTDPVVVDHRVADPQFRRTMSALMLQPVIEGNAIELLKDGEAIYDAMIAAIESAEYSVTFETYEFWGEASAGRLTDALAAAARRGVRVHALPDFIGSRLADPGKFERLESAGVEVVRWRRPSWYQWSRFNHRTHRKLLVVDGRTGFIGGANIADTWLPDVGELTYRDNHFRVEGPVVAQLQAAFLETWLDARGELLTGPAYFPPLEAQGEVAAQVVNSTPREGRHRMRKMFLYALEAAETGITATTAYFYPDAGFIRALTTAAERGVRVRILVPGGSIDQGYLRHASVNLWRPILEAGVELYEYQPAMYHSKLMTVDDAWASIGSANLDNRSFRINDEANLNVFDEGFARDLRELIEDDIAEAVRYDLERWESRPWRKRLYGGVGALIGAYL